MKNKPLLYALILYCCGILSSYYCNIHRPMIPKRLLLTGAVVGFFLFLYIFRLRLRNHNRPEGIFKILTALLCLFIFLFGFFYTAQYHPKLLKRDKKHILHYVKDRLPCTITGTIYLIQKGQNRTHRLYLEADTLRTDPNGQVMPVMGKVRISVYDIDIKALGYKDKISVTIKLRVAKGFRNERYFNYQRHLYRQGIYALGSVRKKEQIKRLSEKKSSKGLIGFIFNLRSDVGTVADNSIKDKDAASVFRALILGDRRGISNEMEWALKRSGLMHLLAVSGLHLGFVLLFFMIIIQKAKTVIPTSWIAAVSRIAPYSRTVSVFSIFPLYFYTILTGMRLSTIRALIMISLYLMAYFFDTWRDYYSTLAWAALIILIWRPLSIFEIDFQLTFLATLGVIYYIHHRPNLLIKYPTWVRKGLDLFLISGVVVFITSPLSVLYFHYVSLGGILLTPAALPFLTIIIPVGLIATIMFPVSQGLSRLLILIAGMSLNVFLNGIKLLANIPWASFTLPCPPLVCVFFFYLSIVFCAWWFSYRKSRPYLKPWLLVTILGIAWAVIGYFYFPVLMQRHTDKMELSFMDVGKGDAALIRFPSGENIMIDGGGVYDRSFDIGEKVLTPYLWSKGIKRILAVIVTHPHPDHIYGLFAILRNFSVDEVWIAPPTLKDKRYEELSILMSQRGVKERIIHAGERITIGPCIDIFCLHPPRSVKIPSPRGWNSRINNLSMVLKIVYNHVSILFSADIEKEAEIYLTQNLREGELDADILKAPHHGSKNSNSEAFLTAVSPEVTIISARQISWYPLPSPTTIERLKALPTRIYRTDSDGAISIYTDGNGYEIETWNESQTHFKRSLF